MSRPRFLIDVDGVLANFVDPALGVIAAVTGTPVKAHDSVVEWDFLAALDREVRSRVFKRMNAAGYCESLPVYPGAVAAVTRLKEFAEVFVVTSPMRGPTWMHERERWIQRHFGISYENVVHAFAKHVVVGDALIEDKPSTLVAWREHHPRGLGILLDRCYNRGQWDGATAMTLEHAVATLESRFG